MNQLYNNRIEGTEVPTNRGCSGKRPDYVLRRDSSPATLMKTKKGTMARMQRLAQNEWVATLTAVGTGGGTAMGVSLDTIHLTVALIGASCAVISTIAAIYFHHRNYKINRQRLLDEQEARSAK